MSKIRISALLIFITSCCLAGYYYSKLNPYGRAWLHSKVFFESWPLESGLRSHFNDYPEEFELVAQKYRDDPTIDRIFPMESKLCVNREKHLLCAESDDHELREAVYNAHIRHSFRISDNRGVLISVSSEIVDEREYSFAYVNRFNVELSPPPCPETRPDTLAGMCHIKLSEGWVISYEWFPQDLSLMEECSSDCFWPIPAAQVLR